MQKTLLEAASFGHAVTYSGQSVSFETACELFHDPTAYEFMEQLRTIPTKEGREQFLNEKLRVFEAEERKRLCTVAAVSRAIARLERRGLVRRSPKGSYWLTHEGSLTVKNLSVNKDEAVNR